MPDSAVPSITHRSPASAACPRILYGTAFKGPQTYSLVTQAITLGYRGIDTAGVTSNYNEAGAGNAIRDLIAKGVVKREEIYIQTKFSPFKPGRSPSIYPYDITAPLATQIAQSIASSLAHFTFPSPTSTSATSTSTTTPYIDSLLIHSPFPTTPENLAAYVILSTYVPHSIRTLGISNVDLPLLQSLVAAAPPHAPLRSVQNRLADATDPEGALPVPTSVDVFDAGVRAFCRERGIRYQPWGVVWGNECVRLSVTVGKIADELGEEMEARGREEGMSREVAMYLCVLGLRKGGEVSLFVGSKREERMRAALEGLGAWDRWIEVKGNREVWTGWMEELERVVGLC